MARFYGDLIAFFHNTIQSGVGNEFSQLILGVGRFIRSDEFVVSTLNLFASFQEETQFNIYNDVLRGTNTLNLVNDVDIGLPT